MLSNDSFATLDSLNDLFQLEYSNGSFHDSDSGLSKRFTVDQVWDCVDSFRGRVCNCAVGAYCNLRDNPGAVGRSLYASFDSYVKEGSTYRAAVDAAAVVTGIMQTFKAYKGDSKHTPKTEDRKVFNLGDQGFIAIANGDGADDVKTECIQEMFNNSILQKYPLPDGAQCFALIRTKKSSTEQDRRWNFVYGKNYQAVKELSCVTWNSATIAEGVCI